MFGHDGILIEPGGASESGAGVERLGAAAVEPRGVVAVEPGPTGAAKAERTGPVEVERPGAAVAAAGLHFDHTSILKTIARRFMSEEPPYMGARYAAAKDLSAVIGGEPRQTQFLPFIRYNLRFVASAMMLAVQNADRAPGTPLGKSPADGTLTQDFSFEDAGGGPRVHPQPPRQPVRHGRQPRQSPGRRVRPDQRRARRRRPVDVVAPAGDVVTGAGNEAAGAGSVLPGLVLDVKYPAVSGAIKVEAGTPRPEYQRWRFAPGVSALDRNRFTISSEAFAGKVLQPANPAQAESMIVLGDAGGTMGPQVGAKAWSVSSPLIDDEPVSAQ